jgi:hypothetical protein
MESPAAMLALNAVRETGRRVIRAVTRELDGLFVFNAVENFFAMNRQIVGSDKSEPYPVALDFGDDDLDVRTNAYALTNFAG